MKASKKGKKKKRGKYFVSFSFSLGMTSHGNFDFVEKGDHYRSHCKRLCVSFLSLKVRVRVRDKL